MTEAGHTYDRHAGPRERIHIEGVAKQAIDTGRTRLVAVGAAFCLCFVVLGARLVELTVMRAGEAVVAQTGAKPLPLARGDIVDRNGLLLATNLRSASLFAHPRQVLDPLASAAAIARVLPEVDRAGLQAKLASDRGFVWIKRHLTPREQDAVNRLGLPGIGFVDEPRRLYPQGRVAAHLVGYTGVDNRGLAGVEKSFDETLMEGDRPVRLTIDVRVQHALAEELQAAMAVHRAIGAVGVVLDVRTGEVLAAVSLPDFDPNQIGDATADQLFNRATLGVYEMGSTFKAFTVAAALEFRTADLDRAFDATEPIKVSRYTIKDDHAKSRWLSVPEIFMFSSNIGAAKMALEVGGPRQREFLKRLGFLDKPPLELPEVGQPMWPQPWREINTMTVAFGHGIAVSPLQVAAAFASLVNGGIRVVPTLRKREPGDELPVERVVSPETSDKMRRLMRLVVDKGTGSKAGAQGWLVGGKTGTAEKVERGGYKRNAVLSSFISAFPMTNPRYVVVAILDEPKGTKETQNFATGGWTAAPITGRVIGRIAPMLAVEPVDEKADDVQKAMLVSVRRGRN
jgi:cell division protein FtsI (penicillin-binding protein 3)